MNNQCYEFRKASEKDYDFIYQIKKKLTKHMWKSILEAGMRKNKKSILSRLLMPVKKRRISLHMKDTILVFTMDVVQGISTKLEIYA